MFSKMMIKGCEVYVTFTGNKYFFFSNFYGLVAIATRDEEDANSFSVLVGNKHLFGGCLCENNVFKAVSRYIRKEETQFIVKVLSFDMVKCDARTNNLADMKLNITV